MSLEPETQSTESTVSASASELFITESCFNGFEIMEFIVNRFDIIAMFIYSIRNSKLRTPLLFLYFDRCLGYYRLQLGHLVSSFPNLFLSFVNQKIKIHTQKIVKVQKRMLKFKTRKDLHQNELNVLLFFLEILWFLFKVYSSWHYD